MPVARSRRQSLHIARVQPEVQAWSQRRCGLLSFRVSTFSYSDDPRTRARRLRGAVLLAKCSVFELSTTVVELQGVDAFVVQKRISVNIWSLARSQCSLQRS